jgi:hypothetical protein
MSTDFYNIGSGLSDITATQVITDYLVTDNVNSISGVIEFNNNNFSNVNAIDGVILSVLNNKAIATSNVAFATSNIAYPTSNVSYMTSNVAYPMSNVVYPMNADVYGAFAFSNTSINILKPTMISTGVMQCSNLNVNNTIVRVNGSNLVDTDKKIDYNTWIKGGPAFSNDNTLAIAALALAGAAGAACLVAAGRQILDNAGNFAPDALDEIKDMFDPDAANSSGQDEKISVNWKAVTNRCLYNNSGSEQVAFGDDLFVSSTKKLKGINPSSLSSTIDMDGQTIKYIETAPTTYTVFDFNTKELFADKATVTTSVSVPRVKVGNFYILESGIYVGDPVTNPFGSQLVIDASGLYQGTIRKNQITDTEAFNYNALADGQLVWGDFGQTSALNDPFAQFTNVPLFDV